MELLRCKIRIAALWVFMAVAISAHSIMAFMEPGVIEKAMAEVEAMGAGMLVFMALFWLVPLWLAFVTITVKSSPNRWVNFILGIIFTLLNIWHFIEHLIEPSVVQILIIGSTVVVTALITWYAWKLPAQEE